MSQQSTNHLMLLEPVNFYANPQTFATNSYQHDNPPDTDRLESAAIQEFRALRDKLVQSGIIVTTVRGQDGCPDDIFCNNWVSTHPGRQMVLYPMLAENRRTERRRDLIDMLAGGYDIAMDLSACEQEERFLESTGALVQDRVNKKAYIARSQRADTGLAEYWCETMGYTPIIFDTSNHEGIAVYHTDVVMFIGTGYAGVCLECIPDQAQREKVRTNLGATHDIIELSLDQLASFCGNALEVCDDTGAHHLVMSSTAYNALGREQSEQLEAHVTSIIHSDIPTIETYGGGSARCMLLELF